MLTRINDPLHFEIGQSTGHTGKCLSCSMCLNYIRLQMEVSSSLSTGKAIRKVLLDEAAQYWIDGYTEIADALRKAALKLDSNIEKLSKKLDQFTLEDEHPTVIESAG